MPRRTPLKPASSRSAQAMTSPRRMTKLDKAADHRRRPAPSNFRGLALAGLLPGAGPSGGEGLLARDTGRGGAGDRRPGVRAPRSRDQFPVVLLRAAYQGLAPCLPGARGGSRQGRPKALRRSWPRPRPRRTGPPDVHEFSRLTARGRDAVVGCRACSVLRPDVHVAPSPMTSATFSLFIQTKARGVVANRRGYQPRNRVAKPRWPILA